MSISFFGMGYVGLTTAVCLAERGLETIGVDVDQEKINSIRKGQPGFYEKGLESALNTAITAGHLSCTTDGQQAVINSDITFVTVGTPESIELKFIKSSSEEIGRALRLKNRYHVVVVKSTVPPGTTENFIKPILEQKSGKNCGKDFGLCFNPEFLREGSAVHDTYYPDKVVIGAHDSRSGDVMTRLYHQFYANQPPPIIMTNPSTAELIKYANNAFLATKISFINTIANICNKIHGADVVEVSKSIGMDKRISPQFLNAGLGYGGSCFQKDLKALYQFSKRLDYNPLLLDAVQKVNDLQPAAAIELTRQMLGDLRNTNIAILGLSFKPNTDDMREAVSLKIVEMLKNEGAKVVVHDPMAIRNTKKILGDKVKYAGSVEECVNGTDCAILVTEWEEYKSLEPDFFIQHMKTPMIVDGRRIFDHTKFIGKIRFAAIGMGK